MAGNFFIEEYLEDHRNLRFYSIMRFAEFTLFLIINGVLLNFVFQLTLPNPALPSSFLEGFGVFLALTFGMMNERRLILWDCHHKRELEIEDQLGLSQCKNRPKDLLLRNRTATRLIFIISGIFWLISLF